MNQDYNSFRIEKFTYNPSPFAPGDKENSSDPSHRKQHQRENRKVQPQGIQGYDVPSKIAEAHKRKSVPVQYEDDHGLFCKRIVYDTAADPSSPSTKTDAKCSSVFDRTLVLEIYYPYSEEFYKIDTEHEILANYEQGLLGNLYHPQERYIYCTDAHYASQIADFSKRKNDRRNITNIAKTSSENLPSFTSKTKLFIVAQGDSTNNKIAGMEEDHFLEVLTEDLGAEEAAEMELVVCNIGINQGYTKKLETAYPKTNIISYKCLLAINSSANFSIIGFDSDGALIEDINTQKIESLKKPAE